MKKDVKNNIRIQGDRVVKKFLVGSKRRRRFRRECRALRRLTGIEGIPELIECDDERMEMVMERIPGQSFEQTATELDDSFFIQLNALVEAMLKRGVARHSMPERDVMVGLDGRPGLVDYERVTLRRLRFSPVWRLSCMISRFHMLRFIGRHRPELLTPAQKRKLGWQQQGQQLFRRWIEWRRRHFVNQSGDGTH